MPFHGRRVRGGARRLHTAQGAELLGWTAVTLLAERGASPRAIDMCCGAGNLACAVAVSLPRVRVWASDLFASAVRLTRRNSKRHGVERRVTAKQGDLFAALDAQELSGRVDLVMANPPYISSSRLAGDRAHLLTREPREAFDGGPYGLSVHQRLVRESAPFLKPGGWLAFEFGHGQHRQAERLFARSEAFAGVEFVHDDDGVPRVALAPRKDVTVV